jgi:hypothetical protein
MNFQIGDRVRFLNEKGEGIIRSINKQFATVEIEEGFDIPFLMAELVKVHTEEKKVHHSPLILTSFFMTLWKKLPFLMNCQGP